MRKILYIISTIFFFGPAFGAPTLIQSNYIISGDQTFTTDLENQGTVNAIITMNGNNLTFENSGKFTQNGYLNIAQNSVINLYNYDTILNPVLISENAVLNWFTSSNHQLKNVFTTRQTNAKLNIYVESNEYTIIPNNISNPDQINIKNTTFENHLNNTTINITDSVFNILNTNIIDKLNTSGQNLINFYINNDNASKLYAKNLNFNGIVALALNFDNSITLNGPTTLTLIESENERVDDILTFASNIPSAFRANFASNTHIINVTISRETDYEKIMGTNNPIAKSLNLIRSYDPNNTSLGQLDNIYNLNQLYSELNSFSKFNPNIFGNILNIWATGLINEQITKLNTEKLKPTTDSFYNDHTSGIWLTAHGIITDGAYFDSTIYGISMGYNKYLNQNNTLGFSVSYGYTDINGALYNATGNMYNTQIYYQLYLNKFTMDLISGYAYSEYDAYRETPLEYIKSKPTASEIYGVGQIRYNIFDNKNWSVEPLAQISMSQITMKNLSESNSLFGITSDNITQSGIMASGGINITNKNYVESMYTVFNAFILTGTPIMTSDNNPSASIDTMEIAINPTKTFTTNLQIGLSGTFTTYLENLSLEPSYVFYIDDNKTTAHIFRISFKTLF